MRTPFSNHWYEARQFFKSVFTKLVPLSQLAHCITVSPSAFRMVVFTISSSLKRLSQLSTLSPEMAPDRTSVSMVFRT